MNFTKRTALVTGGASGLGEATVRLFHAEGANVVILDLNTERGEALAAELGERVRFIRTNVSEEADVQAAVDLALSEFGGLHIAVNCAGIAEARKTLGKVSGTTDRTRLRSFAKSSLST